MAERPIFVPGGGSGPLVKRVNVSLKWHGGFALVQSRKNITALHEGAEKRDISPVLEISSKSQDEHGVQLSAFNLHLHVPNVGTIPVEAAFQGSKVFAQGGPYHDLYDISGRKIKRDARLKESGNLHAFDLNGERWALEPTTAFYDWLYLNALLQNPSTSERLVDYEGFTDIAFNPAKSLNCQARSAALFVELIKRGWLEDALESKGAFLKMMREGSRVLKEVAENLPPLPSEDKPEPKRNNSNRNTNSLAQYELFA